MPRVIIAGNWKMNLSLYEARSLAQAIRDYVKERPEPVVLLCPPMPYLTAVEAEINGSEVKLGAQNVHSEENGAFTGEVSDTMLESVGCDFTLIGHSERRTLFGDDDGFINAKVTRVVNGPLTPILCVGENLEEREKGITEQRIEQQLQDDLRNVKLSSGNELVVAYEPVWAIGTGKTATPGQAEEAHAFIRRVLVECYGEDVASEVSILYGGSVKPDNAAELLSQPNINGALIGGASLTADSFTAIIGSAFA